jgi:hypothetical protein
VAALGQARPGLLLRQDDAAKQQGQVLRGACAAGMMRVPLGSPQVVILVLGNPSSSREPKHAQHVASSEGCRTGGSSCAAITPAHFAERGRQGFAAWCGPLR